DSARNEDEEVKRGADEDKRRKEIAEKLSAALATWQREQDGRDRAREAADRKREAAVAESLQKTEAQVRAAWKESEDRLRDQHQQELRDTQDAALRDRDQQDKKHQDALDQAKAEAAAATAKATEAAAADAAAKAAAAGATGAAASEKDIQDRI